MIVERTRKRRAFSECGAEIFSQELYEAWASRFWHKHLQDKGKHNEEHDLYPVSPSNQSEQDRRLLLAQKEQWHHRLLVAMAVLPILQIRERHRLMGLFKAKVLSVP